MGIIGTEWHDQLFTDGTWRPGGGDGIKVVAPASGEVLGALSSATPDDVLGAAKEAAAAQKEWARRTPSERAAVLRRAGQLWEEHADEIGGGGVKGDGGAPPHA